MNGEVMPQLRDNIDSKGGSFALCSRCGLIPLIGVDWGHSCYSFRFPFFFCTWCGSFRLVIASVASRRQWLPMGQLLEIE